MRMIRLATSCLYLVILMSHCTYTREAKELDLVFPNEMTAVVAVIPFSSKTIEYDSNSINTQPYEKLWPINDENILIMKTRQSKSITLINTSGGVSRSRVFYLSSFPVRDICSFSDSVFILHDDVIVCKLLNGKCFRYASLPPSMHSNQINYKRDGLVLYGFDNVLSLENNEPSLEPNKAVRLGKRRIESSVDIHSKLAILNYRDRNYKFQARFGFDEDRVSLLSLKTYEAENEQLYAHFQIENNIDSRMSEVKDYLLVKNITFFDSLSLVDSATVRMIDISNFPEKSTAYELPDDVIYANNAIYFITGDDKNLFIRKLGYSFPSHVTRIDSLEFEYLSLYNERLDGPIDFKHRLTTIIARNKNRYRLYDVDTFLSYLPDTLNRAGLENEKRRLLIRRNLRKLISAYQSYDEKINRQDDRGVLFTALRFVQRIWYFDSTYMSPTRCFGDSHEDRWALPSDLLYRRHKSEVQGIPYCWGGKKVIEDANGNGFIRDIRSRLAPGNVVTKFKDQCVNSYTTGIDCSGLVVNSFKLNEDLKGRSEIQGTINLAKTDRFKMIGNMATQLKRGDILLNAGKHVAICLRVTNQQVFFVHSSTKPWGLMTSGLRQGCKVDIVSISKLNKIIKRGYLIYRLNTYAYSYEPYANLLNEYISGPDAL